MRHGKRASSTNVANSPRSLEALCHNRTWLRQRTIEDLQRYLQYFETRKLATEILLRLCYEDGGDYSREEMYLYQKQIIEAERLANECRTAASYGYSSFNQKA